MAIRRDYAWEDERTLGSEKMVFNKIIIGKTGKSTLLHSESGGYHTWLRAETTPGKMKGHSAAKKCYHYVSVNNLEGAFKATCYLANKGHKRIACITGPKTMPISVTRLEGYMQALRKSGIPPDAALIKEVNFTERETHHAMQSLMKLKQPPTAIFCFKNDITLDAIVFLKKKYPDRLHTIDFTDFGNLPLFKYLDHKPVASVKEDFFEVGKRAAGLLFEMIRGKKADHDKRKINVKIPCKLIIN